MDNIKILFIGDIVGKPGLDMVLTWLPSLKQKYQSDFIIVNGENVSDGKGIMPKEGASLFDKGVNVITGGNHTWDRHQTQEYLKVEDRVLRPFNYPRGTHGNGYAIADSAAGKIAVLNLQGRTFMSPIDCPFRQADFALTKIKSSTNIVFIDMHAEASAEKIALAYYLDGKVSAIVGTHTHVQTADERILKNGTAYITDVGMSGPYDGVIGMKAQASINRFLYQTPQKYETAIDDIHICGVCVTIDKSSGKSIKIERFVFPEFEKGK